MTTVLILTRYFLPGFKAGGPIRSIAGLIGALGKDYEFKVICLDRDIGDKEPFPSEPVGRWYPYHAATVLRVPTGARGVKMVLNALRHERYHVLYINSVWDRTFSMIPVVFRRLGGMPRVPLVIAPRGEFSTGAIGIKSVRKRLYLTFAKLVSLFDGVLWQASSEHEEDDILRNLGKVELEKAAAVVESEPRRNNALSFPPRVQIASDLFRESKDQATGRQTPRKNPGELRLVTVARVCSMKNIEFGLRALRKISARVQYDIYGPLEDSEYVAQCERERVKLPDNIIVRFLGPVPHNAVFDTIRTYHAFLLPTRGENFGHVIAEALQAGCVPIISDKTPWRNLAGSNAGWDLPLDQPELFEEALQAAVAWSDEDFQRCSDNVLRFFASNQLVQGAIIENQRLFKMAVARAGV